jgi:pilus assembly protein CpaF
MEGDVVCMQEIFRFERHGISEAGKVQGTFRTTGIRPKFAERLIAAGLRLPAGLFESEVTI